MVLWGLCILLVGIVGGNTFGLGGDDGFHRVLGGIFIGSGVVVFLSEFISTSGKKCHKI
jgi:hypothetical protein